MNNSGRVGKTIKNVSWTIIAQFLTYFVSFFYRTVFIYYLGIEYLGAQGLFSNILNLLSFAELGIGNAIIFSLYKPLSEKDYIKVNALLHIYKKLYFNIGCFVGVTGILITPFLDFFIKGDVNFPNKELIYILLVLDTASTYFFAYKKSLYSADQKEYKNTLILSLFSIISTIIQIIILILTKNFIFTLIIKVVFTILANASISYKVNKEYSVVFKEKLTEKLIKGLKVELFKKIRALLYHKFGSLAVNSTDNLLISIYFGLSSVGIYSNYLLLIGLVKAFLTQFTQSVSASIGNLTATETPEYAKQRFKLLEFINFWAYFFTTVCIYVLINPFIQLWIGEKYLFSPFLVTILVTIFYITGMRQNILSFRNALGLFWNDRYKPLIEAFINLFASIILLKYLGIAGVFIGTVISAVTTSLWIEPYILYRNYFKEGIKNYFVTYVFRVFITVISCWFLNFISNFVFYDNWQSFILLTTICILITNTIFILLHAKTSEYQKCYNIFKSIFGELSFKKLPIFKRFLR
ncbi:lipopolysaccharide biosynthesis protein [Bacillus benzoevorans]|uniref:O-antigen/teichoic acid export membrane protein n=1 Tax=Bacillus benzoevorans TaxID=1456 RepID=A0A7X0HVH4_9BACI|nr:hypothetical protein [Bacillus benzoevorans]MBB6447573.1 O-antigen/teichoic acid export membrane protein [Bacillus benzoevorans]